MNMYNVVDDFVEYLNSKNGASLAEQTTRLLKIQEELGEASAAWIGAIGQNPRKGKTHTFEDVVMELGDVVFTTLVAINSLGYSPQVIMRTVTDKMQTRLEEAQKHNA